MSAFHPCLPKSWKMPSRSDIPNSNPLIMINFHFLKQNNWAVTYPQRCFFTCKLEQQLVFNLPFLQRSTPSSNHLFLFSKYHEYLPRARHIRNVSFVLWIETDNALSIEILLLTPLLLDTGRQGVLPRTQGSGLPGLYSPSGAWDRPKLSVPTEPGPGPVRAYIPISHLLGVLQTSSASHVVVFTRCPNDLQNSHLRGHSRVS